MMIGAALSDDDDLVVDDGDDYGVLD